MKSLLPTGSGSQGFISKWKYFDLLRFLNDSLAPRRVVSNVSNERENFNSEYSTDVYEDSNNEFNSDLQFDDDPQSPDGSETTSMSEKTSNEKDQNRAKPHMVQTSKSVNTMETPKPNRKRIRSQKDPINHLIAIEQQKIAHLDAMASQSQSNTEIQDEDYFFLMSLLPHLRSISKDRKLQTRIKIQQLIIDEKQLCNFNQSNFSSVATPSPSTQDHTNDSFLSTTDGQNNPQPKNYRELRLPTASTQEFSGLLGEFLCFPNKAIN